MRAIAKSTYEIAVKWSTLTTDVLRNVYSKLQPSPSDVPVTKLHSIMHLR